MISGHSRFLQASQWHRLPASLRARQTSVVDASQCLTLTPRLIPLVRRRMREQIEAELSKRYRFRRVDDHIEIDFPKSKSDAKEEVVAQLDEIDPRWRRVFAVYPR